MIKSFHIKKEIFLFSVISGLFFMSNSAVSLIIPLKMIDQGLSYSEIGGVIAAFSFGMIFIKLFIGRHSDIAGIKKYLLIAIGSSIVFTVFLAFSNSSLLYTIFLGLLGISRGIFTSVNSAYTFAITSRSDRGKQYGLLYGTSALFMACGGVMAGGLYTFDGGGFAFLVISFLLSIAFFVTWKYLLDVQTENNSGKKSSIFKIHKKLLLICLVIGLQAFVTAPMFNLIVPMYFYQTFKYTAFLLGIVMSFDEMLSIPVYMVSGIIADRFNSKKATTIALLTISIIGSCLLMVNQPIPFLILFLTCSVFVTFTYIGIPKMQSEYIREDFKGFELALVSASASIGEALGNISIGKAMDFYSIQGGIIIFIAMYVIMFLMMSLGIHGKVHDIKKNIKTT